MLMESCNERIDFSTEKQRNRSYRGVRRRSWGKWVSEMRQPGTKKRIWLGSYDKPEMAARAYDLAAVSLKGKSALPNFPHLIHTLPIPASLHPRDIQLAAAQAALSFRHYTHDTIAVENFRYGAAISPSPTGMDVPNDISSDSRSLLIDSSDDMEEANDSIFAINDEYCEGARSLCRIRTHSVSFDEELQQFHSPNFVLNMAEALLLSPPRVDGHEHEAPDYGIHFIEDDFHVESAGFGFLWSDS